MQLDGVKQRPWATFTSGSNGTGNGAISFTVSPNTETVPRMVALTVAGQTVTLTQAGVVVYSLTTSTSGTGTGTISSDPSGTTFTAGTVVTLTATAGSNSNFKGWSGCSSTGTTCQVTMTGNMTVNANFEATAYRLTITKSGKRRWNGDY